MNGLKSVRIVAASQKALQDLSKFHLDLVAHAAQKVARATYVIPGLLTDEQIEMVQKAGYTVEVIADASAEAEALAAEVSSAERFAGVEAMADTETLTVEGYLTETEVELALTSLANRYPRIARLITLPNKTWENRVSHAIHIHAGPPTKRPGVLFTGSMHAREWGGSDICVYLASALLQAYSAGTGLQFGHKTYSAVQVRSMLETLDIVIFPDVNPDGKHCSQASPATRWWRKNRNPEGPVDLNRNFDFLWKSGIGTSSDQTAEIYKGTAPFSEPETRNVRYLFDTFKGIKFYVDVHSYSGLILYNWGDDDNQSADPTMNFRNPAYLPYIGIIGDAKYREYIPAADEALEISLAKRMNKALASVRGSSYTVEQSSGLYPTSGTSTDYAYSRHFVNPESARVFAFCIEFGRAFIPAYAEMRQIIVEVGAALTELCLSISQPTPIAETQPAETENVPVR